MEITVDLPAKLLGRIFEHLGDQATDEGVRAFIREAAERELRVPPGSSSPPAGGHRERTPRQPAAERADLRLPHQAATTGSGGGVQRYVASQLSGITDDLGREWLWGQVNRVLPLKFLLRAFTHASNGGILPYDSAYERIGPLARDYALRLRSIDEDRGTRRDDRLDVGFPSGEDEEAAVTRFLTQFFWARREDGVVSGALPLLGLVGPAGDQALGLTDLGCEFSQMENPLMDRGATEKSRLSDVERDFYTERIVPAADGETAAFTLLARSISAGAQRNSDLSARLAEEVGSDWSDALLSTQRSGTMGRMLDVGLVARHRDGVRVRFTLTARGEKMLQSLQGGG